MKVFLIAGEPSGDNLGAALMAGLKTLVPDVTFDGIGGEGMQAHGLTSRFPMDELTVMGLAEVLPKYRHLKRRIRETAEAVIATRPDFMITIDSPDFSLRVAKLVKAQSDIRCVHYVAPTVWAWRPGRAEKMAKVIDHVLALFPFEPPYMEAAGMECDFVGHPVATQPVVSSEETATFRADHGLNGADPLLLVLPGSRRGEVGRLGPRLGDALRLAAGRHPRMRVVIPAARPVARLVEELVKDWPGDPIVLDPRQMDPAQADHQKRVAFKAADFALAVSGTVALELAKAQTPMVSIFDLNWLSREIIKRMVTTDTGNLINIVTDTRHVPEFVGADCTPEKIAAGLEHLIADPEPQRAAMALTMERLGEGGEDPGLRAARAVIERMNRA